MSDTPDRLYGALSEGDLAALPPGWVVEDPIGRRWVRWWGDDQFSEPWIPVGHDLATSHAKMADRNVTAVSLPVAPLVEAAGGDPHGLADQLDQDAAAVRRLALLLWARLPRSIHNARRAAAVLRLLPGGETEGTNDE